MASTVMTHLSTAYQYTKGFSNPHQDHKGAGLERIDPKNNVFARFLGDSFISECVCHLNELITEKCKDHTITRGLVGVFLTPIFFAVLGTAIWTEFVLKGLYLLFIKSLEEVASKNIISAIGAIASGAFFVLFAPALAFCTKVSIITRHLEHGVTPLVKRIMSAVKVTWKEPNQSNTSSNTAV